MSLAAAMAIVRAASATPERAEIRRLQADNEACRLRGYSAACFCSDRAKRIAVLQASVDAALCGCEGCQRRRAHP